MTSLNINAIMMEALRVLQSEPGVVPADVQATNADAARFEGLLNDPPARPEETESVSENISAFDLFAGLLKREPEKTEVQERTQPEQPEAHEAKAAGVERTLEKEPAPSAVRDEVELSRPEVELVELPKIHPEEDAPLLESDGPLNVLFDIRVAPQPLEVPQPLQVVEKTDVGPRVEIARFVEQVADRIVVEGPTSSQPVVEIQLAQEVLPDTVVRVTRTDEGLEVALVTLHPEAHQVLTSAAAALGERMVVLEGAIPVFISVSMRDEVTTELSFGDTSDLPRRKGSGRPGRVSRGHA